ncbi:ketohexokinase [Ooceraea biroi]|uniref:ketohexokinase n=1 Tax=Ooceraea biroi TaxID=2015173 RepID=UPI000F091C30|nr:ketohexokinase [Ooceraea biroi]XP_011335458.2 ketohexokinase [Ooceraea biroi]
MMSGSEQVTGDSSVEPDVRKILCVGRVCLDIVYTCTHFPSEDSTLRSVDYRWQRGGNASNTCTVLSLLSQPCELLACLSAEEHISFLQNDLRKYKIDCSHCPVIEGIGCPIATILLSLSTGTRTIVYHNQNLPDLTFKDFEQLNLEEYSWIHFEGRNVDKVLLMIQRIEDYNDSLRGAESDMHDESAKNRVPITISAELESPRSERLLDLLPYVDVAFVAKDFAKNQGLNSMNEVMQTIGQDGKSRGTLICAWSEEGAIARTACGAIVRSPAYPPQKVIDTLGAGDTFNAAVLYYLNKIKAEFTYKCKQEVTCASDYNQAKDRSFDQDITVRGDIEQNARIKSTKYNRQDFIDKTSLQRAIKFACCIAGAKVGLRGYDCLDKISSDILQQDFLIH